jgi:uncharacterized protein YjbI with pentapeptide repeats
MSCTKYIIASGVNEYGRYVFFEEGVSPCADHNKMRLTPDSDDAYRFTDAEEAKQCARALFNAVNISRVMLIECRPGNAWKVERLRAQAPYTPDPEAPDYLTQNVSRVVVEGVTFKGNLTDAAVKTHFKKCSFEGLTLTAFNFRDCTFEDCILTRACFYRVRFVNCHFNHVCAEKFEMEGDFDGCIFENTDFTEAHLAGADFDAECDLSGVDWSDALVKLTRSFTEALGI